MTDTHLTGSDNYFENFEVGTVYKHARGKTVTENEAVTICHMVMNTADGHFNDDRMKNAKFGNGRGEQVIKELELDNISMKYPVSHGDTLTAYTEVLAKGDDSDERSDAGRVSFRHYGVNQDNKVVFQGDRLALIRKSPVNTT